MTQKEHLEQIALDLYNKANSVTKEWSDLTMTEKFIYANKAFTWAMQQSMKFERQMRNLENAKIYTYRNYSKKKGRMS